MQFSAQPQQANSIESNEFCPSLAIMVADCEKLCTKYVVDFLADPNHEGKARKFSTRTREFSTRELNTDAAGPASTGNTTNGPFAGLASAGTLTHVTGVSFIP